MILTKKLDKMAQKPGNRNHIWIYDRSQSMYYTLRQLCNDLIEISEHIKIGDTLTLAWFSTEGGRFRTILKGFQITGSDDAKRIQDIVNANNTTIGLTCFSEVLEDTVQTVKDLKVAFPSNTFAFMFFTDGYPVVSYYHREEKAIFEQLEKLRSDIGEGLFIGYGDYYNRSLMSRMATTLGAQLVHADDLDVVEQEMQVLVSLGGGSRATIDLGDLGDIGDIQIVFGTGSGRVIVYPVVDGKAVVSSSEDEIHVVSKSSSANEDNSEKTTYAGAFAAIQCGDVDQAIEWLGKVGDVRLVDMLFNAYTTAEIGAVASAIQECVFDESKRYLDGKRKNYVPARDAFCLLNAFEILVDDPDAKFYPYHSKFQYKRIGVGRVYRGGYPKFNPDVKSGCEFAGLVWNSDRLNLSMRTIIPGSITLGDDRPSGLDQEFETIKWNTYTMIADGNLNVTKLPCSMGEATFHLLQKGKLIPKTWRWNPGEVYVLELKRIPIINRVIADDYLDAIELAENAMREQRLMAQMKVYKHLRNLASGDVVYSDFSAKYTQEQLDYLVSMGIMARDGSYSPPSDAADVEDYYTVMSFSLKPKGWSSLPSMNKLYDTVKSGKNMNAPSTAMWSALENACSALDTDVFDPELNKSHIETIDNLFISGTKTELSRVRSYIQKAKFAVMLGHRWFNEFNGDRDNCVIDVNGTPVSFVLGETKVSF